MQKQSIAAQLKLKKSDKNSINSGNDIRMVQSVKILQRKQAKATKADKFKRNIVKDNISYISPKRIKNDNSAQIFSPIQSKLTYSPNDKIIKEKSSNVMKIKTDFSQNPHSKFLKNLIQNSKMENYSTQCSQDLEKQNQHCNLTNFSFSSSIKQEVTMLKRQNQRLISSNERIQAAKEKALIQNSKMKKIIQEQSQKLQMAVNNSSSLNQQLSRLKSQTSLKDSRIIDLEQQIKIQSLKRTSIKSDGQLTQETMQNLRRQLFELNNRLKYQQIEILTLSRKNSQLQAQNKQISKLTTQKTKLEKRIELLTQKENNLKQRNKYIENKDRHIIIELSPEKEE